MNYAVWNKDLFTGLLPAPQYGDVASITNSNSNILVGDLSGDAFSTVGDIQFDVSGRGSANNRAKLTGSADSSGYQDFSYNLDLGSATVRGFNAQGASLDNVSFRLSNQDISGFTVLALRQAEALQKWREISLSGRQDYKDQIEKHFGVHVSDVLSNMCSWIGGNTSVLDIGEVVNTNLQGINSANSSTAADIAGKGVGSVSSRDDFTASEHGIIMCLYHASPLMDYSDDVSDPFIFKGNKYDYAIPEFDKVGMQSVPSILLNGSFQTNGLVPGASNTALSTDYFSSLGYAPRFYDYKTSVDIVTGAFTNSLKFWAAPLTKDYVNKFLNDGKVKKLSSSFFKINPSILDTIFAVNADATFNSDNLLVTAYADIKAVRNLDYDGLPY